MDIWSAIHPDLLELIFERLGNTLNHYVRFGAVCGEWRSLTLELKRYVLPRIMMVIYSENENNHTIFFGLGSKANICEITLRNIQHTECVGSSNGWLIVVGKLLGEVVLLNPFSKNQILLPSQPLEHKTELQDPPAIQNIHSATVSFGNISNSDYLVMVRFWNSQSVLFCRAGDEEWNVFTSKSQPIEDITYFNGRVYIVHPWKDVHILDLDDPNYLVKIESTTRDIAALKYRDNGYPGRLYLVKSQENLLLKVIRYVVCTEEWTRCNTVGFEVLVFKKATQDWISMASLGDQVLFLGLNSVCLPAREVPECTPNSIYFTDYKTSKNWCDTGVFNMEDKSIRPLREGLPFQLETTIWFSPNPD